MLAVIHPTLSVLVAATVLGQISAEPAPTSRPTSAPAGTVELSAAGYPLNVTDEGEFEVFLGTRADELLAAANEATEPRSQAEHRLAAANWILARQIEPQVSRLVVGLGRPNDSASLQASVAQARTQLEVASKLLEASTTGTEDQRADTADQPADDLRQVHDGLAAFAEALGTVWSTDSGEDFGPQVRRAASSLGVLLEDQRPAVASAAVLYQALLYQRAGRLDRALSVLDLALKPLPREGRPVVFATRLLRCRLVAQQGGYAAAWSVLLRLEERARDWFENPERAEQAARAALLVRLETAEAWGEKLLADGKPDRAAWCQRAADRIRTELHQGSDPAQVIRLEQAIPLMLPEPSFQAKTSAPDAS